MTDDRSSSTATEGSDDHARVNFPPPLVHGVGLLFALGLNDLYPLSLPASTPAWWLGQGLLLVALLLALASFREFARARNPVPPNRPVQALMTGGPFRLSRNPLYLTLACIHGGIALIVGNGWMLATLPMALLVVRFYVIAREEAYLHRRFGNAYLEYQARVRRWI